MFWMVCMYQDMAEDYASILEELCLQSCIGYPCWQHHENNRHGLASVVCISSAACDGE